jgi:hypothetical protein
MKCDRLKTLVKNWYMHVQEEEMAPARMIEFMTKHIATCEECAVDSEVKVEAERIREIVLPPSKVPKLRPDEEVEDEDSIQEVDDAEDSIENDESEDTEEEEEE